MTRWILTTCKGRLDQLKRSAETWRANMPDWQVLVSDWGCPDGAADWARGQGFAVTDCAALGEDCARFWKSRAWNLALRQLAHVGADWVALLDADHLVGGPAGEAARVLDDLCALGPGNWGREAGINHPGAFIAHMRDLEAAGFADESFRDWGAEDWVFRARLTLRPPARPVVVPIVITYQSHSDHLRHRFQPGTCKQSSGRNSVRAYRAFRKLEMETGRRMTARPLEGLVCDYHPAVAHAKIIGLRDQLCREAWRTRQIQPGPMP